MGRPLFTIIAGSNGCGKSTLSLSSRDDFQSGPILDPDAVAKTLQADRSGSGSNIEAGKKVLDLADALLDARESFTVETTLSGHTYLRMAARAKVFGYAVSGIFIGTESVEINIRRIHARVEKGGHDIPEADQRRRYSRTLANMCRLVPLCDFVTVLDNSSDTGHRLIGLGSSGHMKWRPPVPDWAEALV